MMDLDYSVCTFLTGDDHPWWESELLLDESDPPLRVTTVGDTPEQSKEELQRAISWLSEHSDLLKEVKV